MRAPVRYMATAALGMAALAHTLDGAGADAAVAGATSARLIAASMVGYPSCLKWAPVGMCFWLTCTPWGCKVRTSIKIRHYAPDLAISTFHDPLLHPWKDWGLPVSVAAQKGLNVLLAAAMVDSSGTRSREERTDKNVRFRDADAIGHPSIAVGLSNTGAPMLCKQTVRAFQPYLLSLLDG